MQVYLVGGAVRDELLGRPVSDRDWVVVGATPQKMLAQGFTQVGKDFPVFLHPKTREEYALARTERKAGKGYTGFVCDASPEVTLEQDLLRRDLTINAIAKSASGSIIDPYHGQDDIRHKWLRHVSDAFIEDPLRVFRVARFAARFAHLGFNIAPETLNLMQSMASSGELKDLSAERVWQETRRSLMESSPQVYFSVLAEANAWQNWFSELPQHDGLRSQYLKLAAEQQMCEEQRIALLCCNLSPDKAMAWCRRLKVPNSAAAMAKLASRFSSGWHTLPSFNAKTMLTLFNDCDAWRKEARFFSLLAVWQIVAESHNVDGHTLKAIVGNIHKALTAAKKIDIAAILSTGVQGPAIKQAIEHARLEAIENILGN
ncbi:CCA tRNA nucleotidyltransferase [Alteromonas aestuariivivens]|uniref:CCA-adding enzyme n=1 Tax=Alteromonas aestuariivivens TaxID=1938339 RepID=A0A3D8M3N6_9ALTE|nr:CCA tRNA nucleotidyltransferase [Alteromonas aestuariivivens]RDV24343.1 CCA tRNA nucleotidyltransferase [Alteromonas aestuariivivens]